MKRTQRSFNSTIRKSGRPKKTNPARRRKNFARAYHSKARVEFVKGLACAACGVVGYSENAHTETGGMGRKADYTKIVPLCGNRVRHDGATTTYTFGCHYLIHQLGGRSFVKSISERRGHVLDLDKSAEQTEELWRASLGSAPGGQT